MFVCEFCSLFAANHWGHYHSMLESTKSLGIASAYLNVVRTRSSDSCTLLSLLITERNSCTSFTCLLQSRTSLSMSKASCASASSFYMILTDFSSTILQIAMAMRSTWSYPYRKI